MIMYKQFRAIKEILVYKYASKDFTKDGMIEIINASFEATEDSFFGKINENYIKKEIAWYLSKSRNIRDLDEYNKIPEIWHKISSKSDKINSNYGWCIFSKDNFEQYHNIVNLLLEDIYTRKATMIYTRPSMHYDYNENGMSDFICTNTVQVYIRDRNLIYIVNMRSNDVVFGYKNDLAWHKYVYAKLKNELESKLNTQLNDYPILWNANSLHVYPRHFNLIKEYIND